MARLCHVQSQSQGYETSLFETEFDVFDWRRPIKPREMLAMVWDLLTNGMNPIEDIEVYNG